MKTWKKITAGLVALGLLLAPNVLFAQYGSNYFWWQVVDEVGKPYGGQSAVECSVYEIASHGAALMHFDATLGAGTGAGVTGNPNSPGSSMPLLSDVNARFHFYSSNTDDKRIVCFARRGGVANDVRLDRATHRIMIDRQGRKMARFAFVTNTGITNTGIWLPQGAVIRDVLIQSSTSARQGDNHINVGFRGNHVQAVAHAFVRQQHLASVGSCSLLFGNGADGTPCPEFIRPGVLLGATRTGGDIFSPAASSAGGSGGTGLRYHVAGSHRGAALAIWNPGSADLTSDAQQGKGHYGMYMEIPYVVHMAGGIELTYQTSAGSGIAGHVWLLYDAFHVGLDQSITR